MLKQICCEIYPSIDNINFNNLIETNISKAMALKEEEKKILSPFLENMMNFELELKKVSNTTLSNEEEKIEKLISELTNIDVTLSLIDSDMSEIEKEFVEKKNGFNLEFQIFWEKLIQIKIKIEKNSKSIQMHKDLANLINDSFLFKQMRLASHLREDYTNILKEINRRNLFQVEFLKLLNYFDLNKIINEENELRSKIVENSLLNHDQILGFCNRIPLIDASIFNVDKELPSINLEDKNWLVLPTELTESLFEEKKVKKISDSFDLAGSSFSDFGSSFLVDNLSSFEVPKEETNEIQSSENINQSNENNETIIEETTTEIEILEKLTPLEDSTPDIQQIQIDELLKKNQMLEEQNHILEKNNQKMKTKLTKIENENDSLKRELKSKEQFNDILDKELQEKQGKIKQFENELELKSSENLELNEKFEKVKNTKNELKKKLDSTEKFREEILKVNHEQISKIKLLEDQIDQLSKSQQIQRITEKDVSNLKQKYEEQISKLNEIHDEERTKFGIELSKNEVELKKLKNENELFKNKLQSTTKDFVKEIQDFDDYKKYSEMKKKKLENEIFEKDQKIVKLNEMVMRTTGLLSEFVKKNQKK